MEPSYIERMQNAPSAVAHILSKVTRGILPHWRDFQVQWSNLWQSVLACMINRYGHRDRELIRISSSSNMHHLQIEVPNNSNPFKQHRALHRIHSTPLFCLTFRGRQVRSLKSLLTALVFGGPVPKRTRNDSCLRSKLYFLFGYPPEI